MAQGNGNKPASAARDTLRKVSRPVVNGVSSVLTFVGDGRIKIVCGAFLVVAAVLLVVNQLNLWG